MLHLVLFCVAIGQLKADACSSKERKYFRSALLSFENNLGFDNYLVFSDFKTFDEMRLTECKRKYNTSYRDNGAKIIELLPKRALMLDHTLATFYFYILDWSQARNVDAFIIQNIKGIESQTDINNQYSVHLVVAFSIIDFYLNASLANETQCDQLIGAGQFFSLYQDITFFRVKYPKFMCPNIFQRGDLIAEIKFHDISNSFLNKNQLNIIPLANETMRDNSIRFLELYFRQLE